jgi:hypothetical protein
MSARKLLLVILGIIFLVVIGLIYTNCGLRLSGSAVNGGPEDPAIRDVEQVGGVCRRVSDLKGECAPDYLSVVHGDPVVSVDLFNGTVVTIGALISTASRDSILLPEAATMSRMRP